MTVVVEICERKNIKVKVDNKFSRLKKWAKDETSQTSYPEKLHALLVKTIEDKIGYLTRLGDEDAVKAIETIYTSGMHPIDEYEI